MIAKYEDIRKEIHQYCVANKEPYWYPSIKYVDPRDFVIPGDALATYDAYLKQDNVPGLQMGVDSPFVLEIPSEDNTVWFKQFMIYFNFGKKRDVKSISRPSSSDKSFRRY